MLVETRTLGTRRRALDSWTVPPPVDARADGESLTVRDLITRTVLAELSAFESRERARRLVRVLSDLDIADGATRGRIDPGGRPMSDAVDPDAAVSAALQGFVDGMYLVVLDGTELRELEAIVYPTSESRLVFLRLTFLAGA
jgi:hypothetical protein